MTSELSTAFVKLHGRLAPVPLVPEIRLHQADEPIGLWELTEGEFRSEQPPPFWAFAWAGGQALARYVLDHPAEVAGRRVLDLAAGSGLVAIAAASAGAASVRAVDIDPLAVAAVELNASANGVSVAAEQADLLDGDARRRPGRARRRRVLQPGPGRPDDAGSCRRARRAGASVLVGDPGRAFLPAGACTIAAEYDVPVPEALESVARQADGRLARSRDAAVPLVGGRTSCRPR